MANGDDRISVSRDTLRAELATLELRLIERLASNDRVAKLEGRVDAIAKAAAEVPTVQTRLTKLEATITSPEGISDMIEAGIQKSRHRTLTGGQRLIGAIVGICAIASFFFQLSGLGHG